MDDFFGVIFAAPEPGENSRAMLSLRRVSAKGDRGGPWTPPIFFPEKSGFLQGFGGDHGPPQEKWVLEVVDDPPWSCDPTVQSI